MTHDDSSRAELSAMLSLADLCVRAAEEESLLAVYRHYRAEIALLHDVALPATTSPYLVVDVRRSVS